ncbi:MAG: hypothetical protein MAG715_00154 [Methanonatronarchaeales archaeon]|nr:hypothetical protein [Methanonatronarchaeales archaeon]
MRYLSAVMATALLLSAPAAALAIQKVSLWEGDSAAVEVGGSVERFTLLSVDESGDRATIRIDTELENSTRRVEDGTRLIYLYDREGGFDRHRSILVEDVSGVPPTVEMYLPDGGTFMDKAPLLERVSSFFKHLAWYIEGALPGREPQGA